MTIRQYQNNLIKAIADALMIFRKVVAQLATGGGKTFIFAGICSRYLKQNNPANILLGSGKTVLILVHRKELLKQTRKTCYNGFKIVCQPVTAGMNYIPPGDVYVGMVETVYSRLKKRGSKMFGDVGLVIIDEAHRMEFMKVLQFFPNQYIIGFTATPKTVSKKRPMKSFYEDIVIGPSIRWLIDHQKMFLDEGLCQNVTYVPEDTVKRSELSVVGVDFNERDMGEKFSKPRYVKSTVAAYKKYSEGKKALIFNVNIDHNNKVNAEFVANGYDSRTLDSKMSDADRDATLAWYQVTPGAILNNVGIATTGFDEPTIEVIIVNRATLSMPLWIQMTGRGSRPTPTKSMFIIIDMGGNAMSHGDWSDDRDWRDIFLNPGKPSKNTVAPIKICPNCDGVVYASAKKCPLKKPDGQLCGYEFPINEITVESELHDFIMITKGIDIDKVIEDNKNKSEYYAFYEIGRKLAWEAKETVPVMTDAYAEFIIEKYIELARVWRKQANIVINRRRNFDEWHKTNARTNMTELLRSHYPEWNKPAPDKSTPVMPTIEKIEAMKGMHYEM